MNHSPKPPERRISRLGCASLVVIAMVLGLIGWEALGLALAPPGRSGQRVEAFDTLLAPFRGDPKSDAPDAWVLLAKAINTKTAVETAAFGPVGTRQQHPDYDALYAPRDDERSSDQIAIETKTRELLAKLEESTLHEDLSAICTASRVVRPSPQGRVIEFLLPELGHSRQIARICAARMDRLAREQPTDAAAATRRAETFEQMLATGRVISCNFTLIDHLVGFAIHNLAFQRLRADLDRAPLTEDALTLALKAIERQPLPSLTIAFEGERISFLDTADWTHSDDGHGDGRLRPRELRGYIGMTGTPVMSFDPSKLPAFAANVLSIRYATKKQTLAAYDEYVSGLKRLVDTPRSRRASVFDTEAWFANLSNRHVLIKLMVPSTNRSLEQLDRCTLERRGTQLVLALELHRIRHGTYPATLDALVPGELREIPADPISEKPWGYRRNDRPGSSSGGYLLYSLGVDGVDDQGAEPSKDGERAEVLIGKRKGDFVIRAVNPAEKR